MLAIVGATATGKTALGEALAEKLGGEVVCADSRQVYRELETGTGKPGPGERAARPHHLFESLSLASPAGDARAPSAGWYAAAARAVCDAVHARGRLPVLVGGSGLYLAALQRGLSAAPAVPLEVRERVRGALEAEGPEALHRRLARVDPATATRLRARDRQRVTRALEVFEASGRPLSWWHAHPGPIPLDAEWHAVELVAAPAVLARRIEVRTRSMFERGLVEETRGLLAAGLGEPLARLRAVGYDEAAALVLGRLTRAEAEARVNTRTRQLAKRQRTWFRHQVESARIESEGRSPAGLLAAALDALDRA